MTIYFSQFNYPKRKIPFKKITSVGLEVNHKSHRCPPQHTYTHTHTHICMNVHAPSHTRCVYCSHPNTGWEFSS